MKHVADKPMSREEACPLTLPLEIRLKIEDMGGYFQMTSLDLPELLKEEADRRRLINKAFSIVREHCREQYGLRVANKDCHIRLT